MSQRNYITAMIGILFGIFALPEWDVMVKVYVVSVVAFITTIVNVLFRLQKIREYVVNILVADVIQEVLKDPDVRKLVNLTHDFDFEKVKRAVQRFRKP